MKTLLITLLALLLSLGIWSCSDKSTAEQTTGDSKATPVKTSLLQPREFSEYLRITGTVQAKNRVNIVVEESGTLKNIYRDKGNYVRKPASGVRGVAGSDELVPSTADERFRLKQNVVPERRYHYRYIAVEFAWQAADLLPDEWNETARVLCIAGSWLAAKEPKAADRFYKALVRRCGTTKLGKEADKLRWFPKVEVDEKGLLQELK